jgi:hypothetical protein
MSSVDILDKIGKVRWLILRTLEDFTVLSVNRFSVLPKLAHVASVDTVESFIKIPTKVLCVLIADINKIS